MRKRCRAGCTNLHSDCTRACCEVTVMSNKPDKQPPDTPTAPQLEPAGNDGEVQQLTSCQMIEQNLEEMIAEMNAKRSRDQSLLENFKKELDSWCASAHVAIEATLYEKTVKNSKLIDSKLRELVEALDGIRKLEAEMEQFRDQLRAFCVDAR